MSSKHTKTSALLLLLAALVSPQLAAYTPPIGIPDPSWGSIHPIDTASPNPPSDWNGEVANYYYVDPSHPSATDSNNTYGYPNRPRVSMPYNVGGGSYVALGGNFTSTQYIRNFNCTEAAPCWVRGLSEEDAPVISSNFVIDEATYLYVENLDFNGGSAGALHLAGMNTHHVVIRNNKIRNRAWTGNTAGLSSLPDNGGAMHDIVFYNNLMHDLGDYATLDDQDFHAYTPSLWGRDSSTSQYDIWFLNNTCYRVSGDCIQINAGNWSSSYRYLHHIYVGHNTAYQNRQGAAWIKQASDVIVSQNLAYGMNGGGSGNAGHGFGIQYEKDNIWFIFNEVYDSVYGIRQSDTTSAGDIYMIGNLLYDIRPAPGNAYDPDNSWSQGTAIALWHGSSTRHVIDNTIHDVYDGITAVYNGNVNVYGNIVSQKDDHGDNHFFTFEHPSRNGLVAIDRNLFIDEATESYYSWWNNTGISTSLAEIKQVSGLCQNCESIIGSDSSEIFVTPSSNPDTRNFAPKAGSPAIGKNSKNAAYDAFEDRYGIDIFVDFDGNPRKASNHALGAFEYLGTTASPNPPPNIQAESIN